MSKHCLDPDDFTVLLCRAQPMFGDGTWVVEITDQITPRLPEPASPLPLTFEWSVPFQAPPRKKSWDEWLAGANELLREQEASKR